MCPSARSRRSTAIALLTAAGGAVLLAWLVWTVGPAEIWDGFLKIGWGMALIVLLGGLRFAARAAAWTMAIEPPHRLGLRDAFTAVVCGDTLGNVITLGPIVSEAAKLACVRGRVPIGPALTALAIENVLYTLSVAAMVAAATIALLVSFTLPRSMLHVSEAALLAIFAGFVLVTWLLWRRPAVIGTLLARLGSRGGSRLRGPLEKLHAIERDVYGFASRRRGAVLPVFLAEVAFHAFGVIETHFTLWMILGRPPALLESFILEGAVRLIAVVFKFVPYQIGVSEAGAGWLTEIFGMGTPAGVTLSIARKARMGIWSIVGAALLVRQGMTTGQLLADAELAQRRG